MRMMIAFFAGGLFGLGLMISGMTNTLKVQGWLDLFGAWDPTLAFVMGGAILPMAIAWQIRRRMASPVAGGAFPGSPGQEIGRDLALGSVLFGVGWGLAGLCPGPALASLAWGAPGGAVFLIAMGLGMYFAPLASRRILAVAQ